VRRGEAVGIIGSSGTGKSTTLRLAAGLLAPDKGEVLIKGEPRRGLISDDDTSDKLKVGLVFQVGHPNGSPPGASTHRTPQAHALPPCAADTREQAPAAAASWSSLARICQGWRRLGAQAAPRERVRHTPLTGPHRAAALTPFSNPCAQSGALFDSLTVGENVGFLLHEHTSLPPSKIEVGEGGWPRRGDGPSRLRRVLVGPQRQPYGSASVPCRFAPESPPLPIRLRPPGAGG
jgi:hypothetical protein